MEDCDFELCGGNLERKFEYFSPILVTIWSQHFKTQLILSKILKEFNSRDGLFVS